MVASEKCKEGELFYKSLFSLIMKKRGRAWIGPDRAVIGARKVPCMVPIARRFGRLGRRGDGPGRGKVLALGAMVGRMGAAG